MSPVEKIQPGTVSAAMGAFLLDSRGIGARRTRIERKRWNLFTSLVRDPLERGEGPIELDGLTTRAYRPRPIADAEIEDDYCAVVVCPACSYARGHFSKHYEPTLSAAFSRALAAAHAHNAERHPRRHRRSQGLA